MSIGQRWAEFLSTSERSLERPAARRIFWALAVALFIAGGVLTIIRAEVPKKKLVDRLAYSSPTQTGEGKDAQAVWHSSEFRGFRAVAWGSVVERKDPYGEVNSGHVRAYPPFFGIAFFPFALPWRVPGLGSALFFAVSFGFLLLSAKYASLWAAREGESRFGLFALLFLLIAPLGINVMLRCESDMLVLFPVSLAFYLLMRRRREGWAGALLGFAACFKVLPGLFGVYLLLTRRWKALGGMLACGLFCMVIMPSLVWGPRHALELHKRWYEAVIAPYSRGGASAFLESEYRDSNQSMAASLNRFLRRIDSRAAKGRLNVNVVNLPEETVRGLVTGLHAVVFLALAGVWIWCWDATSAARRAAMMASVAPGILLLSEVSLTTHHVLLLLPLAAILGRQLVLDDARARWWSWTVGAYVLALIISSIIKPLAPLFPASALLLAACLALAFNRRERGRRELKTEN